MTTMTIMEQSMAIDPKKVDDDDDNNNNNNNKKTRRLAGRAARRRRRKITAIQQQASDSMQRLVVSQKSTATSDTVSNQSSSSSSSSSHMSVLPMDRSHIWPSVRELRKVSHEDERILQSQLGYVPGNAIRVVARASHIYRDWFSCSSSSSSSPPPTPPEWSNPDPVVLLLYPIVLRNEHLGGKTWGRRFKARKRIRGSNNTITMTTSNDDNVSYINKTEDVGNDNTEQQQEQQLIEPFPTIYWLTHPLLHSLISKLEVEGFGIQCEQKIAASPQFLEQMQRAHSRYGHERWNMLTESDRIMIRSKQWEESAFAKSTRGVAGNRNFRAVKCLHAHAAHYLSSSSITGTAAARPVDENIVGKWVMEEIQKRYQQSLSQNDSMQQPKTNDE